LTDGSDYIRKHHIPHVFPADVLEEAQDPALSVPAKKRLPLAATHPRSAHRHQLTAKPTRDFETTPLLVRRLENGNY